jgi:prepilin-type N-terminal cleavage/methylation domain-containing protein
MLCLLRAIPIARVGKRRSALKNQRGFTLIELLVVIAIIAILAAILFPVFARARAAARQSSCTSNVRQLTLGMNMYSQDYDETYPQWKWDLHYKDSGTPTANNATTVWWNAIYPYVKNTQIFTCPDTNYHFTNRQDGHWGWFDFSSDARILGSGINPAFVDISISYGSNEPVTYDHPKLASLKHPSETLLISDMETSLTGWECWDCFDPNNPNKPENKYRLRRVAYGNGSNKGYFWTDPSWTGPFDPLWEDDARHGRGQIIGYADGHAKFRPSSRTTVDLFGF